VRVEFTPTGDRLAPATGANWTPVTADRLTAGSEWLEDAPMLTDEK